MSFYFTIIGPKDNPLFTHEFGTSKQGADGLPRFSPQNRRLNPFIVHASLDLLDEIQWGSGAMYLKTIDAHPPSSISAFLTGTQTKFLLLSQPFVPPPSSSSHQSTSEPFNARQNRAFTTYNPTSPETEEAMRKFFLEVYDTWVKTCMSPFYSVGGEVTSQVFRGRVVGAARRFL